MGSGNKSKLVLNQINGRNWLQYTKVNYNRLACYSSLLWQGRVGIGCKYKPLSVVCKTRSSHLQYCPNIYVILWGVGGIPKLNTFWDSQQQRIESNSGLLERMIKALLLWIARNPAVIFILSILVESGSCSWEFSLVWRIPNFFMLSFTNILDLRRG